MVVAQHRGHVKAVFSILLIFLTVRFLSKCVVVYIWSRDAVYATEATDEIPRDVAGRHVFSCRICLTRFCFSKHVGTKRVRDVLCVVCACHPSPCVRTKGIFPPFFVTSWQASVDPWAFNKCRVWMDGRWWMGSNTFCSRHMGGAAGFGWRVMGCYRYRYVGGPHWKHTSHYPTFCIRDPFKLFLL